MADLTRPGVHPETESADAVIGSRVCIGEAAILRKLTIGIVALTAGIAGCRSTPRLTPQQVEGRQLYDVHCAHCHEDNDLGLKKVPPNLHKVLAQTTLPSGAPATDAEVERVVLTGKGLMPSFAGRFTKEQLDALVAYMHTGMRDAKTE
jgi:mono/diheme cytochrome c family protein